MYGLSRAQTTAAWLVAVTLALPASPAIAQDNESLFGIRSAGVTYGPYLRVDIGGSIPHAGDARWQPPGESDPDITFDGSAENTGFSAIGIGFDWQNGVRVDASIFGTGTSDVTAPCASASDGSPCSTHADITEASVSTRGVMASVYFSPLEAHGSVSSFQPFVVAGLGIAQNEVGDWTRENPSSDRPIRSFEGDRTSGLAWSLGVGASFQVTRPGRWPIIVEAAWRYYDLGEASGGSTPLPGFGEGEPIEAFSFDHTSQVVTVGVRIPLQRF